MPEHYSASVLGQTKALYDAMKQWAADRGDVSIIGGWAVYELVTQRHAMQSRDVDIVLHSEEALQDLNGHIRDWNLAWRVKGRKRFPDAHFRDEDPLVFRLDAFTTKPNPTWDRLFGRHGAGNTKSCPKTLVPPLEWTICDKLATLHLRRAKDAEDKRAKDLIDTYNLVFHNQAGANPRTLQEHVPSGARHDAAKWIAEATATRPEYEQQLKTLHEWLKD